MSQQQEHLHFIVTAIHSLQLTNFDSDVHCTVVSTAISDDKPQSEEDVMHPAVSNIQISRKRPSTFKPSPRILGVITTHEQKLQSSNTEQLAEHSKYIQPSLVAMEFLDLKLQLTMALQFCEPKCIADKCGSLLASDTLSIPLFPTDYAEKLQEIEDTPELIHKLSLFVTWDNHSILSTIAETSKIPEATMLLTQFDDRIDSSQLLTSFPIPTPSHHMIPYDNSIHTVLAVKLDLKLYHCTLQTVIEKRSLIQDQCKLTSYCLQLLAVAKTDFVIIYWMIPSTIAHLITANATKFYNYYHQNGIVQLAVYPGAMLCTRSSLKVGPLSFFNQIKLDSKLVKIE